jgi:predicted N-formylglutamate amidohydrolase
MRSSLLITCEHASAALPDGIDLGLSGEALSTHISYDRGARAIALELARLTSAPIHLGTYSRLLVDLNRMEDNPAVIVSESSGVAIPGNASLAESDRRERIARYHRPYRDAARADALAMSEHGRCLHLSMHSFEPALDPVKRAFDAGVLFDPSRHPEAEIARDIARHLSQEGWSVRENEPYLGTPEGVTSWLRAQIDEARYVGIEIEACYRWMDRPGALEQFAASLAGAVFEL